VWSLTATGVLRAQLRQRRIFTESRVRLREPDRTVGGVKLNPVSRTTFGFDYDPNWLPRAEYLSDSGGRWSRPFEQVAAGFPYDGQLHLLVHPCWWARRSTGSGWPNVKRPSLMVLLCHFMAAGNWRPFVCANSAQHATN
jgi:hypothetical protein